MFFFLASIVLICRRTGVWSSSGRSSCLPSKKRRDLVKSDTGDSHYSVAWFYFYDFAFVNHRAENSLVIKSPHSPVGGSCSGIKVGDETQVHMLKRMCVRTRMCVWTLASMPLFICIYMCAFGWRLTTHTWTLTHCLDLHQKEHFNIGMDSQAAQLTTDAVWHI